MDIYLGRQCRGFPAFSSDRGEKMARVRLGNKEFRAPGTPVTRAIAGVALVVGGVFGFLPILGFWMIPLGIIILSVDFHPVRRFRRKVEVRWGRWRQRARSADSSASAESGRASD
ncbi:PGPGW domain-containing protein [Parvibaculum sp.]|uniref:PGPGW domain-containing protein n=1 Tax=Parvibaculum sp. TaxID=2024848 RepID=UPI0025EC11C5|nr:PGPGW domain-containing protein [Parvibaculum sp.]